MSWPGNRFGALRQMVQIEHPVDSLTDTLKQLALTCQDLDRRLARREGKFAPLERTAAPGRIAWSEK